VIDPNVFRPLEGDQDGHLVARQNRTCRQDMVVPGVFVKNDLAPETIGTREHDDALRRPRHRASISDVFVNVIASIDPSS
jgi:hypothetical protein